jgi:hypothetical protein
VSKRLYVYAISEAPFRVDDVIGLAHAALSLVRGPSCWLAVERVDRLPHASSATLTAQDAIVRTLAARADALLPLRFGTSFDDEAALYASLDRFGDDMMRGALARVRGREQMTLRAFQRASEGTGRGSTPESTGAAAGTAAIAPAGAAVGAGTAYLRQRAAALETTVPAILQPLRDALAAIASDEIAEPARHPPLIATMYHLIVRGDADRYRATVTAWPPLDDFRLHVSGPSPVYAFAKDALP